MAAESNLRYTKIDYQSHKDALLQRVRARWPRAWNDFLSNSFGIVLVDLVAWSTATLAYVVNRLAGENFVSTMTLRESAVRIGSLTGYRLRNPSPASVLCEASLASAVSLPVTLRQGTPVRSSDLTGQPFEIAQDYVIAAGDLTPKTTVAIFSVTQTGGQVVASLLSFTLDSEAVDASDTTLDLSQYVQTGQSLVCDGDTEVYTVVAVENVPGHVGPYTRLILDRPYTGATQVSAAEVFDRRIALVQGQSVAERFRAPSDVSLTANHVVRLSRKPVIDDTVQVEVNGTPWTRSDEAIFRQPDDTVFSFKTLASGQTLVLFGDGFFGQAVPADALIDVRYRIGGGRAGNIDLNRINTSVVGLVQDSNSPVSILIQNATATGAGGLDAETLEEARVAIPAYTRAAGRAVTLDDYQILAQRFTDVNFGSVAYARASVRTENSLLEGNIVAVHAWTTGASGGLEPLPTPLKAALRDYLQTKAVGTDHVLILDGTSRPVPVSLRFKVFSGFSVVDVKTQIQSTLDTYVQALKPGQPVIFSDLVRSLDETYGVDSVQIATPLANLVPASDTELFTAVNDSTVYPLERRSTGMSTDGTVSVYQAQLPFFPVAAWSLAFTLGPYELSVLPYYRAGLARIIGPGLSESEVDADDDGLPDYHSTVNLLTGQIRLCVEGVVGDLTVQLRSIAGYISDRVLPLYVGYEGENSSAKRQEIRSHLRAWSDQHGIGQAMYARTVEALPASAGSAENVLASIDGVDTVLRVALESPTSTQSRVVALDTEVLRLGSIYINNRAD